jgi:hypothetical protein
MSKDTKGPPHDQNKGQNQGKRKADAISDNKGASHAGNHTSSTKIARFEGMCPACKATFDFKPSGVDVSEFNTAREQLKVYIGTNYGLNEKIVYGLAEHVFENAPAGPEIPFTDINDPHGIGRKMLTDNVSAYVKEMVTYEQNKVKVFNLIWGQCTDAMKHKLRSVGVDVNQNDPLELWKKVVLFSLHKGNEDATQRNSAVHESQCRGMLTYMPAMKLEESIGDFYQRFCHVLNAVQANGFHMVAYTKLPDGLVLEPEVEQQYLADLEAKEEALLAQLFFQKLNKARYSAMMDELENNLKMFKADHYPKTLVAAYDMAANRRDGMYRPDLHRHPGNQKGGDQNRVAFVAGLGKEKQDPSKKAGVKPQQKNNNPTVEKSKKDGKCFICDEVGHFQGSCPLVKEAKKLKAQRDASKVSLATMQSTEDSDDEHYMAFSTIGSGTEMFAIGDILCDNQSTVNIFKDSSLLSNVRKAKKKVSITGIGGTIVATRVGDLDGFGEVYYHPESVANILSFHDLASKHDIKYHGEENLFRVTMPDRVWDFKPRNKLYVFNPLESVSEETQNEEIAMNAMIETVVGNKKGFQKAEIKAAKAARELWKKLAYPSVKDFIWMLNNGKIVGTRTTVHDVKRMLQIYGVDPAVIKGRVTRKKAEKVVIEEIDREISGNITLAADIMFVENVPFLITISRRLQLILVCPLANRKEDDLKIAFEDMLAAYKLRTFTVVAVLSDGEKGIAALETFFATLGIVHNPTGRNEHVPEVERAIRLVKERVRILWNGFPYQICNELLIHLVCYCVSMVNLCPKSTSTTSSLSPREMFTGRKVDAAKELRLPFGSYCQVHDDNQVINSMLPRSTGAVSLGPTGSIQGTYKFLSLNSWRVLHRRSWTALPMSNEVIRVLNDRAVTHRTRTYLNKVPRFYRNRVEVLEDPEDLAQQEEIPQQNNMIVPPIDPIIDEDAMVQEIEQSIPEVQFQDGDPSQLQQQEDNLDQEVVEMDEDEPLQHPTNDSVTEDTEDPTNIQTVSAEKSIIWVSPEIPKSGLDTTSIEVQPDARIVSSTHYDLRRRNKSWQERAREMSLTTYTVKAGIKDLGVEALVAIMDELDQLHKKGVFAPINVHDLSYEERIKALRTIMFLKKKRDGRIKARLVADGSKQKKEETSFDVSSPTVSTESVFIVVTIAAGEKRKKTTTDVEGAYLHCDMVGRVLVRLAAKETTLMLQLYRKSTNMSCSRENYGYCLLKHCMVASNLQSISLSMSLEQL